MYFDILSDGTQKTFGSVIPRAQWNGGFNTCLLGKHLSVKPSDKLVLIN